VSRAPGVAPRQIWAIVASRFHATVVDRLVEGAEECLARGGVPAADVVVHRVAGAFEVPQLASSLTALPPALRPTGIVALAAVVRGETPHFEHVAAGVTRGLMDVALRGGLPLGFGVLTCDTLAQALARAGGASGNKGHEAAAAALDLARALDAARRPPGAAR
jgi:6,7-dimethyl-8-ribityllumazine synthase